MSFGYVENGFSPSTEDLKKINKYTRREFDADSLYVFTVILCDNDIDRDFEKFSLSALNELNAFCRQNGYQRPFNEIERPKGTCF